MEAETAERRVVEADNLMLAVLLLAAIMPNEREVRRRFNDEK